MNRQEKLYSIVLFTALFAFLLQGCKGVEDSPANYPQDEQCGTISIAFSSSSSEGEEQDEWQDFYLCVQDDALNIVYEWTSYDQIPENFLLGVGQYSYFASLGSLDNLPSFTDEYYQANGLFTILSNETTLVPIELKHAASYMTINFDESLFDIYYSSYYLEMYTQSDKVLIYDKSNNGQAAGFVAGDLTMKLYLVQNHNDESSSIVLDPIALAAGQSHTLNLTINAESGFNILDVTTDFGYEFTQQIDSELPGTVLPFTAPLITAENFEVGGSITSTVGVVPEVEYSALVAAYAGVKSVIIKSTSAEIAELWGGLYEIDIVNSSIEVQNMLVQSGITWDGDIDTPESAELCYSKFRIYLSGLFANLTDAGDYPFEIEVIDIYSQSNLDRQGDQGDPFTFTYSVNN